MLRGDAQRTGRGTQLPDVPRELWHRKIRGGLALPPAIDAAGSIVVAAAVAELVQVSAQGNEQWHQRIGLSVATAGPVLTSEGTRVVLTALGDAWGFRPDGTPKFQVDLSRFGTDPRVAPLPLDNGHLVVAVGAHLIQLDGEGVLADHVQAPERLVGMLVQAPDGIVATSETGKVMLWQRPIGLRIVGSYAGAVRDGAVLVRNGAVAAVVDSARLVEMDLTTGATATLAIMALMDGPPLVDAKATVMVMVSGGGGMLLGIRDAEEALRVSLNPAPVVEPADAGAGLAMFVPSSPAPVVDSDGRVGFVRGDGRVGVVSAEGRVTAAATAACVTPIGIVPAGDGKFVVACRNGSLKLYGP